MCIRDRLKSGRSPGTDKITEEMIKNMRKKGKEILLEIINKAWTSVDLSLIHIW